MRYQKRLILIVVSLVAITVAHYTTPLEHALAHSLYQHLYYIPVLISAVSYGWMGGVLAGATVTATYLPHIRVWSQFATEYAISQYTETAFFILLGMFVGLLSERERGHRLALEERTKELNRVYRELQQSFEQLKRADRLSTIGQLAASLAHEIRTPLASIEGAVEILARQPHSEERRREFLPVIQKECRRLNSLLTSLLEFARPQAPNLQRIPVKTLLDSVLPLMGHAAQKANVVLRNACSNDDLTIECDPEQMKQVLVNLVLNAVQAMPNGGVVTLGAERRDGAVVLWVRDEGEGVAEDELDKIFEPFYTTKKEGTGLGLAICQKIVGQHGGTLTATRNNGRGMTFWIQIPEKLAT